MALDALLDSSMSASGRSLSLALAANDSAGTAGRHTESENEKLADEATAAKDTTEFFGCAAVGVDRVVSRDAEMTSPDSVVIDLDLGDLAAAPKSGIRSAAVGGGASPPSAGATTITTVSESDHELNDGWQVDPQRSSKK